MRRHGLGGLAAAQRDGCRDEKGKFIPVPQCTGRRLPMPKPQERPQKPKKPRVVSKPKRAKKKAAAKEKALTKDERDLLRVIGDEKMHLDDLNALLYKETGLTPYAVSSTLLMLELKGMIHQSAGKMFQVPQPPKMPPAPLEAFAFRIEPKEEAIVKRIEKGQPVGKDEVKFSHLLQYAHTYYEPEDIRSKLIADKERKAQMNHGGWAKFKLSKADDKKYGKIVLEMLQEPKGVHHESIEKILEPYISGDHVWGLIGRLYLAGKILEVSKYRYKTAPGGYTPMQIKDVKKANFRPYLGYVPMDPANRVQDEQAMKMYLQENGIKVNADDTVTLYHATDKQSAASIKKAGFFKPTTGKNILEKIDDAAWFSTDKEWVQIWGHTKTPTILTVKVPAIYLRHMPMNFKEFYFEGGLHKRDGYWTPVRAPKENWVMKIARRNWEEATENLGYVPIPRERKRGRRLFHMLSKDYGGRPTVLPRKDLAYWTQRSGKSGTKVYALFAYSADHAREQIREGDAVKVTPKQRTSMKRQRLTPKQLRLFGLSGKISTCAYWIPTNGDYTCGGYAPTCEAQSPGACKPPSAQYKICATTQKVKSDPKGRYGGKLVSRCKTYRSRCMPDTSCIEDKLFLKPETFKLDKKEVKDIAASMAKEFNLVQKEVGPALAREIIDRGGLKAYRGESATEEWAEIPLHLKRKEGSLTMDEMASEMRDTWGFDSDTALIEAIEKAYPKGKKTVRRKTWKDYEDEAEQILIDEQQRSEYAYEEPVPF